MISTAEALQKITDLCALMPVELVPLAAANGRVLAQEVVADRDQPPFAASAMDGYAVRSADLSSHTSFEIIGESAAGSRYDGALVSGQTVRIFTGAPMPDGADHVVIQEDVTRSNTHITLNETLETKAFVRPAGGDFTKGAVMKAPRRLGPSDIALLASMNIAEVPVFAKPKVAIIATGDELVMPGETPGPDQIIASNNFGLSALFQENGAETRMLPIAGDSANSLQTAFALCAEADLIVTIGGASVGDYDIVHKVAADLGMKTSFYTVAMRPGKPLMAGRLNEIPMIGLPGNPVSSMICGHIFILPALRKMSGLGGAALSRELAQLGDDLGVNGGREHYMRANLGVEYAKLTVHPADRQDSALLSVLSGSNALLVRPPHDPAKKIGDMVEVIRL